MGVKFSNNGHSTLAASLSSSATSITVASGHGARFPSLSSGEYFYATLIDASNNLEIVKVTGRSSDVLTATRAQESTTARAYAIGDRIELRVTAQGLADATTIQADEVVNSMIATDAVNSDSIAANAVTASELNISGNGTSGQAVLSDGDGSFSYGSAGKNMIMMVNDTEQSVTASTAVIHVDIVTTKDNPFLVSQSFVSLNVDNASNKDGSNLKLDVRYSTDGGSNYSTVANNAYNTDVFAPGYDQTYGNQYDIAVRPAHARFQVSCSAGDTIRVQTYYDHASVSPSSKVTYINRGQSTSGQGTSSILVYEE